MPRLSKNEEYKLLIKENPKYIKQVPRPSEELCALAFQLDKSVFPLIPNNKKTYEMCKLAVEYNNEFVKEVPYMYWTCNYTTIISEHVEWYSKLSRNIKETIVYSVDDTALLSLAKKFSILSLCDRRQAFLLVEKGLATASLIHTREGAGINICQKTGTELFLYPSIKEAVSSAIPLKNEIIIDASIIDLLLPEEKELLNVSGNNSLWNSIASEILSNDIVETEYDYPLVSQEARSIQTNYELQTLSSQFLRFRYISDIHLRHQIRSRGLESPVQIRDFLVMIAKSLADFPCDYAIFAGDVTKDKELYKLFFELYLRNQKSAREKIIVILGNHELCNNKSYRESVEWYKNFFAKYPRVVFLHNQFLIIHDGGHLILDKIEDFNNSDIIPNCVILGGIGFAHSDRYSAHNIDYGPSFDNASSIGSEAQLFEQLYLSLLSFKMKCPKMVISHNPPQEWTNLDLDGSVIYVHGHTHRNNSYTLPNGAKVRAGGQIGYKRNAILFSLILVDYSYDIFGHFEDGLYPVTNEQYLIFLKNNEINSQFTRTGLQIYMLKCCGYYMFFASKNNGEKWYVLHGGMLLRSNIKRKEDIQYYSDRIPQYVHNLDVFMKKYRDSQKAISDAIISLGGLGKIHGCIIDIDIPQNAPWSFCHTYLNPENGQVTFYYAEDISSRIVYPSFAVMLDSQPKLLGTIAKRIKEQTDSQALALMKSLKNGKEICEEKDAEPVLEYGTEMYKLSRIIYKTQRILDKHIISIWSEALANGTALLSSRTNDEYT